MASSFVGGFRGGWRNIHAHEVAHVLGRPHAVQASDNGTTAARQPKGYCSEVADAGTANHPYIATVGGAKRPVLGPMGSGEDDKVYGVDTRFAASGGSASR